MLLVSRSVEGSVNELGGAAPFSRLRVAVELLETRSRLILGKAGRRSSTFSDGSVKDVSSDLA